MPVATAMPRLDLEPVIERARSDASAGCECSPDAALWRLCIWGWFPPDWCGNLSLHCYAARLSVLARMAFCGLYPHELSVRTTPDGCAEDRFAVQGVDGAPPTQAALAAIEKRLRG